MDQDHFLFSADEQVVLIAAGMALATVDGHSSGLTGPAVAAALVVTCCADKCDTSSVFLAMPMLEAGRLIGAMTEFAERAGTGMALQAAVDQGRAWARQAVR